MENKLYWYELCFYGDEDTESDAYDPEKACSYVIKTEIPPVIKDETALAILFKGMSEDWVTELKDHCTCVMQVTEEEADFFDVEDLTIRIEDELGIYYMRK